VVQLFQPQTDDPLSQNAVKDEVQCNGFIESATEQTVREPLYQGELVGSVNMLADRMTIQDTQVGCEIEDLKPAAGHVEADGLF
jgi:hypothetical protein